MLSRLEILKLLLKVEGDERLHCPPANIQINAPLALIQVDLKARQVALRQVLEIPGKKLVGSEGYWTMDGRAHHDIDKAYVLTTCDTLEEALEDIEDYGADTCIVDVATQTIVESLMWRDKPYTEEE